MVAVGPPTLRASITVWAAIWESAGRYPVTSAKMVLKGAIAFGNKGMSAVMATYMQKRSAEPGNEHAVTEKKVVFIVTNAATPTSKPATFNYDCGSGRRTCQDKDIEQALVRWVTAPRGTAPHLQMGNSRSQHDGDFGPRSGGRRRRNN